MNPTMSWSRVRMNDSCTLMTRSRAGQLARLNEQLSKLEHNAAPDPSAVVGHRPPRSRSALRGVIGLLLAVFIVVGAFVSQSSYGDEAKLMVAQWAPQLISTSSLPIEKPGFPAQPSLSTVQVAAATPGLPQPTASAETAPQEVAPTAAPISPELTQLLQTMARDLANVQQGIEQLKTSQEELAREMLGPPSSSRRARSKWRARSPTPPSRTCGAGRQRQRRRRSPPLRVDPCRRFRRRKPERKRGRQCSCGPDNSSFHRSRRPPKAVSQHHSCRESGEPHRYLAV